MDSSWPVLRFLNEDKEIDQSQSCLPHWHQENTACFVTYRLDDSIPADVLFDLKTERRQWLEKHPEPWSEEIEREYHQRFSARIDRFLDECHGSCLLRDPGIAAILTESFQRFDQQRYLLHAWVVMPNHVHLLLSLRDQHQLSTIVSSWKRFTSARIHRLRGGSGSLWQRDYFDRLIRNWDHFINVARYIRRNPQKAKLPSGHFQLYTAPWVERLLS